MSCSVSVSVVGVMRQQQKQTDIHSLPAAGE
jgi:hypothetical protein